MYKNIKAAFVSIFFTLSASSWAGNIAHKITIKDVTMTNPPRSGYPYITGFAMNNSDKMISYIRISANFYEAGALVDSQRESITNFPANKEWKFKIYSRRSFDSYEIIKIED